MVRRGICAMLQAIPEVAQIHACADLDETAGLVASQQVNVLIISAQSPLCALEKMLAVCDENDVRMVVLLHSLEEENTSALGELAVDGFLLEEEVTEHSLQQGLAGLASGQMAMPGRLARTLLAHIRTARRTQSERTFLLTPREQQALVLLADGMSNKQIARRLNISEHGAKRHVANVMAKLNCPNRTLAVALAMRYGLLGGDGDDEAAASRPAPGLRPGAPGHTVVSTLPGPRQGGRPAPIRPPATRRSGMERFS
jgi:DNA-binding NarL/FixJ family response regulator